MLGPHRRFVRLATFPTKFLLAKGCEIHIVNVLHVAGTKYVALSVSSTQSNGSIKMRSRSTLTERECLVCARSTASEACQTNDYSSIGFHLSSLATTRCNTLSRNLVRIRTDQSLKGEALVLRLQQRDFSRRRRHLCIVCDVTKYLQNRQVIFLLLFGKR